MYTGRAGWLRLILAILATVTVTRFVRDALHGRLVWW